jgi:putative ATPase
MPEGTYALAEACVYLAAAPKSNAATRAWHKAKELIDGAGALPVPMKLRNAVTPLMREEGYGAEYRYPHDFEGGVAPGETYLPDELRGSILYEPTERGEESRIRERLAAVRSRREP